MYKIGSLLILELSTLAWIKEGKVVENCYLYWKFTLVPYVRLMKHTEFRIRFSCSET